MPDDESEEFSAWGALITVRDTDPRLDQPIDPLQPDGPTTRSMARDHLARYTADRRALDRPLFPSMTARATSARNDYHAKLFTQPLADVLPADAHARLESQAQRSSDPDRHRARQVVKSYLNDVFGTPLPPEQYDHARTQFARQHLGLTSDTGDKAVFAALKGRFTEDQAVTTLISGKSRDLYMATLTGREGKEVPSIVPGRTIAYEGRTLPDPDIGWRELAPQIPERHRAGARHAYYEAYLDARRVNRQFAPAVDQIETKLRTLRDVSRETGTENFLGDLWEEAAAILPDHPGQRAIAIDMLRARMQDWSADERGAFERTLASAGRGLRRRARGFYDAARATGEEVVRDLAPGSDQARLREAMGIHNEKVRALQALQYSQGDALTTAADSYFAHGIILGAESASSWATAFAGPAGLLAMGLSTSGERYTEARLAHPDADRGHQLNAALLSGTIETKIEQSFNALGLKFLKGKMPSLAGTMNKAGITSPLLRGGIGYGAGYLATTATQYAEEALQEGTNRFLQDIANELSGITPTTDWQGFITQWATVSGQEQRDTLAAILPFALIAGGGASFKHFQYGEYLRHNSQLLRAIGVPESRVREIITTADVAKADAAITQAFADGLEARTAQERADAIGILEEQARILERTGLPVVTTETHAITGRPEHIFTTPQGKRETFTTREEALEAWSSWTLQQNQDDLDIIARAANQDVTTFMSGRGMASAGTRGEEIDLDLTPEAAVRHGYATPEQMQARMEIFALHEGRQANAAQLRVFARRFSEIAQDGTYRAVVQYFRGADPLNIVEDFAEDAWDRGLAGGALTGDELIGYIRQTEAATGQRYLADGYAYADDNRLPLLEALSKASTEFILGNAKAAALPARFRQWLEMITAVTANAFRHAQTLARSQNLMAAIQEGKIDPNFERLIADSVGLNAEAIERRRRGIDHARLDPETAHDSNAIETGSSSFSVSSSIRSTFASPPSSLTFEPSDESRPRILEIARANGIQLVRPVTQSGTESHLRRTGAGSLRERFGIETFFYRGGDRKTLGFTPAGNPELIFINADPESTGIPVAWVFAHELLHVAQKDSKADAAGLSGRIKELLTPDELAEARAQISRYGYTDAEFDTELPAFLSGDAIARESVFGLKGITRAEEIRAEIENYFDGLGKLSPSSLADTSDNDLASLGQSFSIGSEDKADRPSPSSEIKNRLLSLASDLRNVRGSNQANRVKHEIAGRPLKNLSSGIEASITGASFRKMLADSSASQPGSAAARIMAIGNIDHLFRVAILEKTLPGTGRKAKGATRQYIVPMPFDGEVLRIRITTSEPAKSRTGKETHVIDAVDIIAPPATSTDPGSLDQEAHEAAEVEANYAKMVRFVDRSAIQVYADRRSSGIREQRHGRLLKGKTWEPGDHHGRLAALADAIVERIDRRVIYSEQKRHQPGVRRREELFAPHLTPTPEERMSLESPLEIVVAFTADGRARTVQRGTNNESSLGMVLNPGDIVSHNHPSGRGPSGMDLMCAMQSPGSIWRILAVNESKKTEIFSVMARRALSPGEMDSILEVYKKDCEIGGNPKNDTPQSRRRALHLLMKKHGDVFEIKRRELP